MKSKKSVAKECNFKWWKAVVGVVAAVLLVAILGYMVEIWRVVGHVSNNAAVADWRAVGLQHYGEVGVSDDGNWYLIPDVRVKLPYFKTVENARFVHGSSPLRYFVGYEMSDDANKAEGFRITLTYDVSLDRENMISDGYCVGPFAIDYNLSGSDSEYRTVAEIVLSDGRAVELKVRTNDRCKDFVSGERGEFLEEQFSRLESY